MNVRSVYICIWCQILSIVKGNDKNTIVDALTHAPLGARAYP
jgi:hypothetical protein